MDNPGGDDGSRWMTSSSGPRPSDGRAGSWRGAGRRGVGTISDDLTPTPSSGKIRFTGFEPGVSVGDDAIWTLPPADQIAKMSRKALRERIHAYIEHAERGDAQNRRGGVELAIVRAQYLRDELARRNQNRQTRWIIGMTFAIAVMTLVIMSAPPDVVRSTMYSLLIRASQVIDLWWSRG